MLSRIDSSFPRVLRHFLPQHAYTEASKHKHHIENQNYDARSWDDAIGWLTDMRSIIIGTRWYSGQDGCDGIEDRKCGTSGSFRGYHARVLVGFDTHDGMICPVVQNSHGIHWGRNGRAVVLRDLWENVWQKDPNFFALAMQDVDEFEPKRRDWAVESKSGDLC